jgi:dimethylhistidine N-methyltransferase
MAQPAASLHWLNERTSRHAVRLIDRLQVETEGEREALIASILATSASVSPKYFYDAIGCTLFEAICGLPEYYPTRTERAILNEHRDEIARAAGTNRQFVDLGAGDCAKASLLLPALQPMRYVAVDIAAPAIVPALSRLALAFPRVELVGVVTDFSAELDLADAIDDGPTTFFYPGSSIGNFDPVDALALLLRVRKLCGDGSGLLIGVDTKKDRARLEAAYNDALGVTAAFNRNVLNHVNSLVDADFDPSAFTHVAFYDESQGRIEMHLEATSEQNVQVAGHERVFAAGERIHTENSYKYAPEEFADVLRRAGFAEIRLWQDAARDFAVYHAA